MVITHGDELKEKNGKGESNWKLELSKSYIHIESKWKQDEIHINQISVPHNVLAHNVLAFSIRVRVVSSVCTTQDYRESGKKKDITVKQDNCWY